MSEERKAAERLAAKGFGAVILLVFAFWAIPQLWDKLSPFIIAVPLAAMLQPVVSFAQEKLKIKRGITVLICVLLLLGILIGLTYWAIKIITEQAPGVVGYTVSMVTDAINTLQHTMEDLLNQASANFSPQVQEMVRGALNDALIRISYWGTEAAADVVSFTVSLISSLPYSVIYLSFLAMALYFITIQYKEIRSYLPGGKRRRQDSNTTQLTNSALRSLVGYLRVQGTFALMVLVVSLIALSIFGFNYVGVISMVAGVMEMIPMVGSGLLYILMGVVYFLTGNTTAGIQVLALTGFLQLLRRILEPKLMSNRIGISPLLSLIGMFVGMRFGGIIGLIGGPVAMAVLVGAFRGDIFKSVNDDMYLLVQWFRRRWAKTPETVILELPPETDDAEETAENPENGETENETEAGKEESEIPHGQEKQLNA